MKTIVLVENVAGLVKKYGPECCGFLTLTFPEPVLDSKEASRRFNSFRATFKTLGILEYICVQERHKSGGIHFHLVVAFNRNIRGRMSDKQIFAGRWASAPSVLRELWATLREIAPKYSFGRANLKPVAGNGVGCGLYLAKYLSKGERHPLDKGVRLVRFGLRTRWCSSAVTYINSKWRIACCRLFGDIDVRAHLGKSWAYLMRPAIDKMIRAMNGECNFSQTEIDSVRAYVYYGSSLFSFTGFRKRLISLLGV